MRIFLCGNKFDRMAGGAERSAIALLNHLNESGYECTLVTWDDHSSKLHYSLNSGVRWLQLGFGAGRNKANAIQKICRLVSLGYWYAKLKPEVIICFQFGVFYGLRTYLFYRKVKYIVSDRNSPVMYENVKDGLLLREKYFLNLKHASVIVAQTEEQRMKYPKEYWSKISVIPNFPPPNPPNEQAVSRLNEIIYLGRLSYQKQIDILINAFHLLRATVVGQNWRLVIGGEGEQQQELKALVSSLDLGESVHFAGKIYDVNGFLKNGGIFCLPSLWEGYPNSLVEAMANGLPCIGFADCDGVNEILSNGTGHLVEERSAEKLAQGIHELICSSSKMSKYSNNGLKFVENLSDKNIGSLWEKQLKNATT